MGPFKKKVAKEEYVVKYPNPKVGEFYAHRYIQFHPFLKKEDMGVAEVLEIKNGWVRLKQNRHSDEGSYITHAEIGRPFDENYTLCVDN